jgi:hypothetical protein
MSAYPVLTPISNTNISALSSSATAADAGSFTYPLGVYSADTSFLSGAASQVSFVYQRLGGDILDIELKNQMVFSSYEEACLEYSYLVNLHQAKNSLPSLLGNTTASFNELGEITTTSLANSHIELKYPNFQIQMARKVSKGLETQAGVGGNVNIYTASFSITNGQQQYDLQQILSSSYPTIVGNKKVVVSKVFYKTAINIWRFFGYYGALNVIGNLSNYGMFSDNTTFEVVPTWQNKLQAIMYEDSINTRISQYSYDIRNNKLRLYPTPDTFSPSLFWLEFYVPPDAWEEEDNIDTGVNGINNMNTLPFANIPYASINSIGKHWIRRYSLAICKEMLGQVRGKFSGKMPIPGDSITLNSSDLLSQAKEEKQALREELMKILDELTYAKVAETQAKMVEDTNKALTGVPLAIFVG